MKKVNPTFSKMKFYFLTFLVARTVSFLGPSDSHSADDKKAQKDAMSAFEQPLLSELLLRGYSPKNSEIATRQLLDELTNCWNSDRNASPIQEQTIIVFGLGGKKIVTYESECLAEFLKNVDSLPDS